MISGLEVLLAGVGCSERNRLAGESMQQQGCQTAHLLPAALHTLLSSSNYSSEKCFFAAERVLAVHHSWHPEKPAL